MPVGAVTRTWRPEAISSQALRWTSVGVPGCSSRWRESPGLGEPLSDPLVETLALLLRFDEEAPVKLRG